MTRRELDTLLVDRALVGLESDDSERLAALLEEHPDQDAEVYERLAADLDLALWGHDEPLPPGLAARLDADAEAFLATAQPHAVDAAPETPVSTVEWRPAWSRGRDSRAVLPWRWFAVAAAALVLIWLGPGGAQVPRLVDQRAALVARADTVQIAWDALDDPTASEARGDVVWNPALQAGVMRLDGLRPNDPERFQYQLWIFDAERDEAHPVDGGVFDVPRLGEVLVPVQARLEVGQATLFAITVERPGGVVVSSRERLALVAAVP